MTQQKKTKKANKINYVTASPEESKGIREGIQEILEGKTISFEDSMKAIEAKKKKVEVKKGTKIKVDTEKVEQWSERIVSMGEIVNDTIVTRKSNRVMCYLEECMGDFTVPAGEIWLVDEERYLI